MAELIPSTVTVGPPTAGSTRNCSILLALRELCCMFGPTSAAVFKSDEKGKFPADNAKFSGRDGEIEPKKETVGVSAFSFGKTGSPTDLYIAALWPMPRCSMPPPKPTRKAR